MSFMQRKSGLLKAMALVLSLALPTVLAVSAADARVGGGFSSGSRGSRTFSAPPSTSTAPSTASPFNRTLTQPGYNGSSGFNSPARGGFFNRGGMLGGLAAGFLGAGLLGMLFGGGLFSGLSGFGSILGLILQIMLIVFLARMAMAWWQRRNQPAYAGTTPPPGGQSFGSGMGFGGFGGSNAPPLEIQPADYEAFERLLGDIQAAWSNEDVGRLRLMTTPEMASYFERDLEQNQARGVVNKVSATKLLQGDLAEAWREGDTDYATVALKFSLVDKTVERATGRLVEGSDQPQQVTEIWTFSRHPGSSWQLSAIQQAN